MKCIHFYNPKNSIERVTDEAAHAAVRSGKARYIPRHVWKQQVRDIAKASASKA